MKKIFVCLSVVLAASLLASAQSVTSAPAAQNNASSAGKIFITSSVFDFGSYKVLPKFVGFIEGKAADLKNVNYNKLVISGYTDNIGGRDFNIWLSKMRAQAVADIFIKNGVPKEKIEVRGFGPDNPSGDNATAAGRAANRRVEITVE